MFGKFKQAWLWSKAINLYFDQRHEAFLKEMGVYASRYKLSDFERVVVANAKLLIGRNVDAKAEFLQLSTTIDRTENPFLSLYCRASLADLDRDRDTYERLKKEAQAYRSTRFDRALPM